MNYLIRLSYALPYVACFALGFAFCRWEYVGAIKRHMLAEKAPVGVSRPAKVNNENTYCVMVVGQSNAASHGQPRSQAGANCYALTGEGWFMGIDPWPGGTGSGGSVWSRLAPRIRHAELAEYVVVGCVAVGSSSLRDWLPQGRLSPRIDAIADAFDREELEIDAIIWHQGETEAWVSSSDGIEYGKGLGLLVEQLLKRCPAARIVICQVSRDGSGQIHSGIRLAQEEVCRSRTRVLLGPDTDAFDAKLRHDGVHWNERGMEIFADALVEKLRHSVGDSQ